MAVTYESIGAGDNRQMKSSRTVILILAVVLVPGGLLLLLPLFAKTIGGAFARLATLRFRPLGARQ